jgi:integrase
MADGGGLYVLVSPTGAKLWRHKYRLPGKEGTFAIGSYPEICVRKARAEHEKSRELIAQGIHPRQHRIKEKLAKGTEASNTFKAIASDWIAKKKIRWSPYYLRQVQRFMESDVFPRIGSLPIKQVTPAHLLAILKDAEDRGAETVAIYIRQWCSGVFRHAVANLQADIDPSGALKGAITRPKVKHSAALSAKEPPVLLTALKESKSNRTTTIAIELLLLMFVRTVEIRKAEWKEFDFEAKLWRIPAERMKMKTEHLVPLSAQVLVRLIELRELTGDGRWLFPNHRTPNTCMSATTISRALERMGYKGKLSAHGFRSTASTLLHEQDFQSKVIESQLAHAERNKSMAPYNHADYLPQRTAMMQHWANYIYSWPKGAAV